MEWVFLLAVLLLGVSLLGFISWREHPREPLQTVELRFGSDLTEDTVASMLASITGLRADVAVVIDTVADRAGIRHFLHAPPQTLDALRSQWRGVLPTLHMRPAEGPAAGGWTLGSELRLSGAWPVLRSDVPGRSAAALLGAMQPLGADERLLLRFYLRAGTHPALPQAPAKGESRKGQSALALLTGGGQMPRDGHLRALRVKYAGPIVSAVAVVAVAAGHRQRAAHLSSRVTSALRARSGAYGQLVARPRAGRALERLLAGPGWRRGDAYSPEELVGLVPLPIGAPRLPGVSVGTAPVLMPSQSIPSAGRVLGRSTWPGEERLLAQPVRGGLSHMLVCGPTGVGKSEVMASVGVQDVEAGRGLLLVDAKGDTAESVLARIPGSRLDDVIVLDPAAGGPLPGLRLFAHDADPQLTADLLTGVFADVFSDSWGPMSSRWLRAGLLLLAHDEQATLADFPFLFSNHAFRRRLVARLDDPVARQTWQTFERMSEPERMHALAAPLQKLEELAGRSVIRGVLAQSAPKLDFRDVLARGRVVIVTLNPGRLGAAPARLLGAVVLFQFFSAVQARAGLAPERRRPFFAVIDEPALFNDIPTPIDEAFALARGLGVGLVLGAQSLSQLPGNLRAAATSNAASWVVFRQSAADARLLAPELGVEPESLQHLGQFEALIRIGLGPGEVAPPATARTLPLPPATSDPQAVRHASAARYGTDPAEVDAALLARHQAPEQRTERPIGRLRRQP